MIGGKIYNVLLKRLSELYDLMPIKVKLLIVSKQLELDFTKAGYAYTNGYSPGKIKTKVQAIITATIKRMNREKDPDRRWRLKIIKSEFSKLRDELA